MAMPEAAMYEDDNPATRENQVRLAGQPVSAKPVTKPLRVQRPPEKQFRRCVLSLDARHHAAACSRIDNVGHSVS
jgi:hypothetical protein